MGIFDRFKSKPQQTQQDNIAENTEKNCIYAPIEGEIIPLAEIADGVFSEGILGNGCGIKPAEGKMYAPFDGEVIQVADTKHAIGLLGKDGIELLIHVGMDTVSMNGKGFSPLVKTGDKVKCGQLMMDFSISDIKDAGFVTTTAVVVTNSDNYEKIETEKLGQVQKLEKIIKVS
ncbi:PTS sugar transporter subunit IIA [Konateibacter massiliensis]|uniref:PTS sugar transporter subunit IIA n=1 Tax=Konateibacter massiliensis TaxID=2002841 RepID=UPI000C15C8D0|nr:PTS glucose transporter subunit IIA [Konateibacter massiliensis]